MFANLPPGIQKTMLELLRQGDSQALRDIRELYKNWEVESNTNDPILTPLTLLKRAHLNNA